MKNNKKQRKTKKTNERKNNEKQRETKKDIERQGKARRIK